MLSMTHLDAMLWDFSDQLKSSEKTNEITHYVYSGGERVRKVVMDTSGPDGPTMKYERIYLGGYELYREYKSGDLDKERATHKVMDDQRMVAMLEVKTMDAALVIGNPDRITITRYQYTNHLDSASMELDENAQLISYEEFHPFGTTAYAMQSSKSEASTKRYRYVHKELDTESGLYYYGARYYAPWLCRFVSVDPLKDDYPYYSTYQYAGNRPIIGIDRDGLELQDTINPVETGQQVSAEVEIVGQDNMPQLPLYIDQGEPQPDTSVKPPLGYIIKEGDTFWDIENALGLEHGTLQNWNSSLDPKDLQIGQIINIENPSEWYEQLFYEQFDEDQYSQWNDAGQLMKAWLQGIHDGGLVYADAYFTAQLAYLPFAVAEGIVYGARYLPKAVSRGTDISSEVRAFEETGFILSDAARIKYFETGGDLEAALTYADDVHQQWLQIFGGDLGAYAEAHAQLGTMMEQVYGLPRTLISVTATADRALLFTNQGNILSGSVSRFRLVKQSLKSSTEDEYLLIIASPNLKMK